VAILEFVMPERKSNIVIVEGMRVILTGYKKRENQGLIKAYLLGNGSIGTVNRVFLSSSHALVGFTRDFGIVQKLLINFKHLTPA
jgi:hypothetical protein